MVVDVSLKILALLDYLPNIVGGAEVSAYLVLKGFLKKGHKVYVVAEKSSIPEGYCASLKNKDGFTSVFSTNLICRQIRPSWVFMDVVSLFLSFIATLRYIKAVKPDVVFTHKLAGLGSVVAAKLMHVPSVYVVRGYQHACFNGEKLFFSSKGVVPCVIDECNPACLRRCGMLAITSNFVSQLLQLPFSVYAFFILRLRKHAIAQATVIVGISEAVKNSLKTVYPTKNVIRIYNPIDLGIFQGTPKEHQPFYRYFVYVGRFSKSKGIDVLLKAFKRLLLTYPECRLALIGSGSEYNRIKKLAKELNIEKSATFVGYLPFEKVLKFLDEKGFGTVVPSLWEEAFGRVVVESMAMGVPVIASRMGGMTELITDKQTGLLVQPGDESSLLHAMEALINKKELYKNISSNSLKYITSFSASKIAREYETVLENLIAQW